MKTLNRNGISTNWVNKLSAFQIFLWSAVYFGIIWGLAPFLDRPIVQPIFNEWVFKGHGLASFPIWGYSLLIILFGSVNSVVILQSLLGAFATAALMVRLNHLFPLSKTITTTLFMLALPWFSYMAYAYQMPISSSILILTLLALELSILTGMISWGIVAGILGGIGANFRSELLLVPFTIMAIVFILKKINKLKYFSIRPLVVCVGVALMVQLPWALHCYFNAARFSLSESSLGHVAYLGLGELPDNPWKIEPLDNFAQETVIKAGLSCSSLSFQGGNFLMGKFFECVKQNPGAFLKCLSVRLWETITHPFSSIALSSKTAEMQKIHEIVKKDNNTKEKPVSIVDNNSSKIKIMFMWFYYISNGILNRAISILGIIGFFLAMRIAPFRLNQPLILCLAIVVLYRCGLNIFLFPSGKYMTGVYLFYLPFVVNTFWFVYKRWLNTSVKKKPLLDNSI